MLTITVKKSDNFKCVVCYEVATKPHRCAQCNNFVCGPCESRLADKCPICRSHHQMAESPGLKRSIASLRIMCDRECGQKLTYGQVEDHSHSPLCPNKEFTCIDCKGTFKNKEMISHMTAHMKGK